MDAENNRFCVTIVDLVRVLNEMQRKNNDRVWIAKAVSLYRRARACPSPCLDPNEKRPGSVDDFRADRALAGDRPPRYGI